MFKEQPLSFGSGTTQTCYGGMDGTLTFKEEEQNRQVPEKGISIAEGSFDAS